MYSPWLRFGFAALAACTATTVHAVNINPRGYGQALFLPYYTVNKQQDTLLSLSNADDLGKAVAVYVHEGMNGREVASFLVYLSPHDMWTATVSQTADDAGAKIVTHDHSCAYPPLPPEGRDFRASAYAGGSSYLPDGGPTSITRTREGWIEAIVLGDIIPQSNLDIATTHVQTGAPGAGIPACTASSINNNAAGDLVAPSSRVAASASIVNVNEGTYFAYPATAIAGVTELQFYNLYADLYPPLLAANTADSATFGGAVAHLINDRGQPLALDYENGIDAVSAVLMADAVDNEFLVASSLGANTDWIVTFPTKRLYVDATAYNLTAPVPPFPEFFHSPGVSPVTVQMSLYDQEEGMASTIGPGVPPVVPPLVLPYEVNVVSFLPDADAAAPSGVLARR